MTDALAELAVLEANDSFVGRHIGPSQAEIAAMLTAVGAVSLDDIAAQTVPAAIRSNQALDLPAAIDEAATMAELRALAASNTPSRSLIGMGYHGTVTPPVILRNVLESLHAVPGRNRARPPGSPGQFSNIDHRTHRAADRQCLAAGRGDGGGRGGGDGACRRPREVGRGGRRRRPAPADRRRAAHARGPTGLADRHRAAGRRRFHRGGAPVRGSAAISRHDRRRPRPDGRDHGRA